MPCMNSNKCNRCGVALTDTDFFPLPFALDLFLHYISEVYNLLATVEHRSKYITR